MAALANALHHQREVELSRAENLLASQWQGQLPASSDPTGGMITPFITFCNERKLRYSPATPFTVAAYVEWLKGLRVDGIPAMLQAIEELSDQCGHANPVSTYPVRLALHDLATNTPAPRSWTKDEKISWPMLPAEVRLALARRAQQTERELRRLQNDLAEQKRKTGDAEKVIETLKEEISTMTKVNKDGSGPGVGPYSVTDMPLRRGPGFEESSKDISKIVDKNHEVNDGFAGGLSDK